MGRLFAGILVLSALAAPSTAHALARSDHALQMGDGVSLAATFYEPDGARPAAGWPAVLILHGLGGSRTDVQEIAEAYLAPYGYAVLTVDARGHGQSGGQASLAGPREVADYAAALSWLRARPGINDAKIGAVGVSLGGGVLWKLLTSSGTRLAAAVPIASWTSLWDALLPQGFAKSGLVHYFRSLLPPERWDPEITTLTDDALAGRNLPRVQELARARSARNDLEKIRTPVFMIHGRRDYAFDMEQALATFGRLKGAKRLYLGSLGHVPATNPAAERAHYLTQARLWLDLHLKGCRPPCAKPLPVIELAPDPWTGKTTSYRQQPPRRVLRLRFRGRKTIDWSGAVNRTTEATRRLNETFGTPLVALNVSSTTQWPHVVAVLSALTPRGEEVVVSQGAAPTPTLSERSRLVTIRLLSQATTIPRGSRLRLTIAGSSTAQSSANLLYGAPIPQTARVSLGEARVILPVLKRPVSRL